MVNGEFDHSASISSSTSSNSNKAQPKRRPMANVTCWGFPPILFRSKSFQGKKLFPQAVKRSNAGKKQKKKENLAAEEQNSMNELRKKILTYRDIIDLPPCEASAPTNELLIGTMVNLNEMYPEIVPRISETKGMSINQELAYFCRALKSIADSWMKNHEWKFDIDSNLENSSLEHLVEVALATLDIMIKVTKEKFDMMDEDDDQRSDYSPRANRFNNILTESDLDYKSTCSSSPDTPTSVLPEVTNNSKLSYTPSLLLPLRVQAVGKLNPIDVKRLSFHKFSHVATQDSSTLSPKNEIVEEPILETEVKSNSELAEEAIVGENINCKTLEEIPKDVSYLKEEQVDETRCLTKPPVPIPVRFNIEAKELLVTELPPKSPSDLASAEQPPLSPPKSLSDAVSESTTPSPLAAAQPPLPPTPSPSSSPNMEAPPNLSSVVVPTMLTTPLPPPPPPPSLTNLSSSIVVTEPPTAPIPPPPPLPLPRPSQNMAILVPPPPTPPPTPSRAPPPPPPTATSGTATKTTMPLPPPMMPLNGSVPPPPPMQLTKGGAPPPPPPLGSAKSLRAKKSNTKLKRSTNMGNLYRLLREKVEGKSLESKSSNGRKSQVGGSASGKQGMADALAEMTKRSAYFIQIEEDVQKYAKTIAEMKASISSFQTKDMAEMLKFHKHVESHLENLTDESQVLARFEGFPTKKLEALRTAAALYSKLDAILSSLVNWKIVAPLSPLLDKVEGYFNKIKGEVDAVERTKDEESKKFQSHNITFDFNILVKVKEAMVDVSSNCMELALKEKREAKETMDEEVSPKKGQTKGSAKILWRAFQLAFRVYTFAGGHDDRAEQLTKELALEIETDAQHQ